MYGLFDWQHTTETGFFVLDRAGVVRLAIFERLFRPIGSGAARVRDRNTRGRHARQKSGP
jgi:hypothetical protein